jgi:hypothetical protein
MVVRSLAFHVRNAEFLTIAGILMVIKTEESVITGDNQKAPSNVRAAPMEVAGMAFPHSRY